MCFFFFFFFVVECVNTLLFKIIIFFTTGRNSYGVRNTTTRHGCLVEGAFVLWVGFCPMSFSAQCFCPCRTFC